jgi:hypothetical protein
MKNIHLLKTYKPTGIFQSNSGLQFSIRDKVRVYPLIGFHIYITSDEEIKEGDWICDIELNRVKKSQYSGTFKNWKKIILTTDQDLIADGVQAIDDEFLEWFVKNPSCEEVEIQCRYNFYVGQDLTDYRIIIPREEAILAKWDRLNKELEDALESAFGSEKPNFTEVTINAFAKSMDLTLETEPETLEEAMSKDGYYESDYDKIWREGVHFGAKWQAENMPIHIIDVENIHVHIENGVIIVEKNKKK